MQNIYRLSLIFRVDTATDVNRCPPIFLSCHLIFPSCHPERSEGSVIIHKNIFSQEIQPNSFILSKSELPVQLKAFFLSTLYRQKQEDGSNDSYSKTPWRFTQNTKAFFLNAFTFLKNVFTFL